MDIKYFIEKFEAEITEIIPGTIKQDTVFKQLGSWNSMQALIFIAMVDSEFGVTLTAENLHDSITVSDLFLLVQEKINHKSQVNSSNL